MTIDETVATRTAPASGPGHDRPTPLPAPRGPLTVTLLSYLRRDPEAVRVDPMRLTWQGRTADAAVDDDLQLAMWLVYELRYRGLVGVDDGWECQPGLAETMHEWEGLLHDALAAVTRPEPDESEVAPDAVPARLLDLAGCDDGPSRSEELIRDADVEQFRELLIHHTMYRLEQTEEFELGAGESRQAQLFRTLLEDWGLNSRHGHYLDRVPGVTLLAGNIISLFGLHRRYRGALVGHLTLVEMTSSVSNARYARSHRRLGGSDAGATFFDEHALADAMHEPVAAYDLARAEPALAADILFGARCAAYADAAFADWVMPRWTTGRSSLLPESRTLRFDIAS
jgi:hypothetical protein